MIYVFNVYERQKSMYPSLESFCLKTSLAASLMAFSGVTRVRFTAAPGNTNRPMKGDDQQFPLRNTNRINLHSNFMAHHRDLLIAVDTGYCDKKD